MNRKPITIVTDFEAEYMERIQNYTLKDLADKFGMSLNSTSDNVDLVDIVNRCVFADLMYHEPFKNLPVLGHYVIDNEQYFTFAEVGKAQCDCCNRELPVYQAIRVSEHGYGLSSIIGYEEERIPHTNYKTIRDVIPVLEKHTCAMDAAFLL